MMTIIIDGYNFIFNSSSGINVSSEKLQKLRDETVSFLSKYYNIKKNKVIVVFDAYRTDETVESRYFVNNVEIIYSRKNEKADDVIIRLAKNSSHAIVVTNDNGIRKSVEGTSCSCLSVEEFKTVLRNPGENYNREDSNNLEIHGSRKNEKKHGNPHRLSKKERNKIKKIKKI